MAVQPRAFEKLDDDDLLGIVKNEIDRALGDDSQVAADRRKALDYYYGADYGNEIDGRSRANLTDVRDTVEWMMPSLMRMFTGGNVVAEYEPSREEDVKAAKEATDSINHIFLQELNGFRILMDWFKTTLIEKNGFVAVFEREISEPKIDTYRGLDEQQIAVLLEDPEVEIVGQMERPDSAGTFFDVKVRRSHAYSCIKVEGIPPEEFLIAARARELSDDTPFCAWRRRVTRSALIAAGFDEDLVLDIPAHSAGDIGESQAARFREETDNFDSSADRADAASHDVWVTSCFMRVDQDGDGYAEKRWITVGGDDSLVLLENIEVNQNPFCSLTAIPVPHKFYGLSVYDLIGELQFIRATLLRQLLDNIYLTNNIQTIVEDGAVEIEDLLTRRPGGIIRADHTDAVKPLEVGRLDRWAFDMLEYLQGTREERTGVTRYNQGLDATSLNKTATGITSLLNAANARIELIGRIFAETGMRDLFKKLLRLHVETPQKSRTMRLRGEWVSVDPRSWNANMDVTVRVGMGFGQAAERMGHLMQVMEIQARAAEMGMFGVLVTPENVYNATSELLVTMGYKATEQFFTNPAGKELPPPPPDPKMIEAENRSQKDQADVQLEQARLQHDANRTQADTEFKYAELAQKREIELAKIDSQERIEAEKLQSQERVEKERLKVQAEVAREKAAQQPQKEGEA